IEAEGAGGACVLHDCVPSKTFIASSDVVTAYRGTERFGIHTGGLAAISVDAAAVHNRVRQLAAAQSQDIHAKLVKAGVEVVAGHARLGTATASHRHAELVTRTGGSARCRPTGRIYGDHEPSAHGRTP